MDIKLIAVDLDGTLLNSDNRISVDTKLALQKAADLGIKIVPCSGRPFPGVKEYLEDLDLSTNEQYAVTFNGALVFNLTGDVIVKEVLHYDDFKYFVKLAREVKGSLYFEEEDNFVTLEHNINYMMSREAYLTRMPIHVRNYDDIKHDFEFTKAMFSGLPEELIELQKRLPKDLYEKYNVSTSDPTLVEINSHKASKGNALLDLARELHIRPDKVMIFGDQINDLSMFSIPEFNKIAMGNAVDSIKEKADFVTKTNDQDGIAYALKELVFK